MRRILLLSLPLLCLLAACAPRAPDEERRPVPQAGPAPAESAAASAPARPADPR